MNSVMNVTESSSDGLYYSARFPLLSCVAAVCCGIQSERDLFSKDGTIGDQKRYIVFCLKRYGLSVDQTKVLTAAAANIPPPGKRCVPTSQQLEAIVQAMEVELELATVPSTRTAPRAEFDPAFENIYPTVLALYRSLVLGESVRPDGSWHARVRSEFAAQNTPDCVIW